jgi:hypothetical protein
MRYLEPILRIYAWSGAFVVMVAAWMAIAGERPSVS